MGILQLSHNREALIDDDLLDVLSEFKWCLSAGYPSRRRGYSLIYLHHVVIGYPPEGFVTDHINRNKLDARRENLRHVTQRENMLNTKRSLMRTGISIDRTWKRYKAYLDRPNKKRINIGTYKTREDAIAALASHTIKQED